MPLLDRTVQYSTDQTEKRGVERGKQVRGKDLELGTKLGVLEAQLPYISACCPQGYWYRQSLTVAMNQHDGLGKVPTMQLDS